jgi:PIN domain nuclease of toxin-antitoxin system
MNRLLLDTQVLLWWLIDSEELGSTTRAMISDRNNRVFISPVAIWELSLKKKQGVIKGLPEIHQLIEEEGFEELLIDAHHCQFAAGYGGDEPFRSVLMAQTQTEGVTLVTADHSYYNYFRIRTWDARR